MSTTKRVRPLSTVRPAVNFVASGRRAALVAMAATAFVGGSLEAAFLLVAAKVGIAITDQSDSVDFVGDFSLSIGATLGLGVALVAVRTAFAVVTNWQTASISSGVVAHVRHRLARGFICSSWPVQQQQRGGSLQELLSSYSATASQMVSALSQTILNAANLTALVIFAVAASPVGAVGMVLSVAVLALALRPVRSAISRRSKEATLVSMEFATAAHEISGLGLEVQVFGVQESVNDQVDGLIERTRQKALRLNFLAGLSTPTYLGLAYLILIVALSLVAISASSSVAALGGALLVMMRSLSYGQALQSAYAYLFISTPPIDELRSKIDLFESNTPRDGTVQLDQAGPLTIEAVSFTYDGDRDVLQDVSLTLEPRTLIGLVGPSGSGKSTLVHLMLGLREPTSGRIEVGGVDIADINRSDWVRRVTFVPQSPTLISGSIADNIRFYRDEVSQADIERAAKMAYIHDEIVAVPGGYDRILGGDERLSGGQQQRLCIARALAEQPDLLILDEPTSALDAESEHRIRETMVSLRDHMTVVVIAHRMSTVDLCDRIMVLEDGVLRGFDTPEALRLSNEFYRRALELSRTS